MSRSSGHIFKLLMMIGGLGLSSLAELQKPGLTQQQQGGLDVIEAYGFTFDSTTNIYSLTPPNELYAGETLQLILQNPLTYAPSNPVSIESSAIREKVPYSNIQILTYGGSYEQPPNDIDYFQPAGINANFDANIEIDIKPGTSGVSLPLMSNGVTAKGDAITPQYPWGNDELYVPQFGISLLTFGTAGFYANDGSSNNYQGGNGGDITASTTRSRIQVNGSRDSNNESSKGFAWEQLGGAILLSSVGGHGGATSSGIGYLTGGNGGNISLEVSDTLIELNNLQGNEQAPYSGIAAISQGGQGGACCVYNLQNGEVNIEESVLYRPEMAANEYYKGEFEGGPYSKKYPNPGSMIANGYAGNGTTTGGNGNGGLVSVETTNTLIKGTGSYLRGVVAASVGGSTEYSPLLPGGGAWSTSDLGPPYYTYAVIPNNNNNWDFLLPGSSDNVEVTLNKGTVIDLKGVNLIGVSALSTTAPYIIPTNIQSFQDYTTTIGNVKVLIDETSKIGVNGSSKGHSLGVLAVSAGSFGVNPFAKQDNSSAWDLGTGQAGEVSVDNRGTINVQGKTSIGLAAISSSNSGGISQAGTSSSNGASFLNGRSKRVDIDHSGTISANGETAIGIYAGTTGSGGMRFDIQENNNKPSYINGSNLTPSIRTFVSSDGGNTITPTPQAINTITATSTSGQVLNDGDNVTVDIAKNARVDVGTKKQTKTGFGVVAQSIGSGGGITTGGSAATIGDGQDGSTGGNGGKVTVNNSGSIHVKGEKVVGVLTQSIGGGGGAGASNTGLFTAVGGQGGYGGNGGLLNLNFAKKSNVQVEGDFAAGVIAHTIGGGGGYGGTSTAFGVEASKAVGGGGGAGGKGGDIVLRSSGGLISTTGQHSQALLLQSIGGGGGVGGSANSKSDGIGADFAIAVGGTGGSGGDAGTIRTFGLTDQSEPITLNASTNASDSSAILIHSVGGGGGSAGSAVSHSMALGTYGEPELPTLAFSSAVGGNGGNGGNGGLIDFAYQGSLLTQGNNSYGILAQSIGGGGGNGGDGTANSGPESFWLSAVEKQLGIFGASIKFTVDIGTGGKAGDGGNGGDIQLTIGRNRSARNDKTTLIVTTGDNAVGAMAHSIGGGGGSSGVGSGFAFGATLAGLFDFAEIDKVTGGAIFDRILAESPIDTSFHTMASGSATGADGVGGNVAITVDADTEITTIGSSSHGLVAQSIGGGGGRSMSVGAPLAKNGMTMLVHAGGAGGGDGTLNNSTTFNVSTSYQGYSNAGSVSIENSGDVTTGLIYDLENLLSRDRQSFTSPAVLGSGSFGLFAQSVGGGGGEAGQVDPAGALAETALLYDLISNQLNSQRVGDAFGFTPQQIDSFSSGGQPLAIATPRQNASAMSYYASINVGGAGGGSNPNTSTFCPLNQPGNCIFGGNADDVALKNNGTVTTYGHNSIGVFGQSVGGGGGVASSAIGPLFTSQNSQVNGGMTTNIAMGIGGGGTGLSGGGNAGNGGNVSFSSENPNSSITTSGYGAHGLLLQTIGGGGGLGIEASTLGFENPYGEWITDSSDAQLALAFKANDGTTYGAFGDVPIDFTDSFNRSQQSQLLSGTIWIGAGVMRDAVPSKTLRPITTSNNSGGTGGAISIGSALSPAVGSVVTYGDSANAVFAQTIGGGGGLASIGCTNRAAVNSTNSASPCWGNTSVTGDRGQPAAYVSGQGASGAQVIVQAAGYPYIGLSDSSSEGVTVPNGTGDINIFSRQKIATYGDRSMGVVAQSIASWGGYLNTHEKLIQKILPPFDYSAVDQFGDVNISLDQATISTTGDGAWGLFAQSALGGGFVGDSAADLLFLRPKQKITTPGEPNNDTRIKLRSSSIHTTGRNAHGIVAQNLGGAGGAFLVENQMKLGVTSVGSQAGGFFTSSGGIDLLLDKSSVFVEGEGAHAVVLNAQSLGFTDRGAVPANGETPMTVALKGGSSIVSKKATALALIGGSSNEQTPNTVVVNNSLIKNEMFQKRPKTSANDNDIADNQWAVYAPFGYTNVTIGKGGRVIGNINLGGLSGTKGELTNLKGGSLEFASAVVADNSLHNHGRIHPYGDGTMGNSTIDGSLKHYKGGEIYIDVDKSANDDLHDHLAVSGLAIVSGEIVPKAGRLLPLSDKEVLSARQIDWSGSVRDSLVFDWEAEERNNVLTLSIDSADFTPSGTKLARNEQATGQYLQKLWDRSSSKQASLFGYISNFTKDQGGDYANVLNQISGLPLNSQAIQMKTAFATSLTDSFGCPAVSDDGVSLDQTDCVWARWTGSVSDQSTTSTNAGYRSTAGGVRLGAQKKLSEQWLAGFTFGYDNNNLSSSGFTSQGEFIDASISAQTDVKNWSFGASLGFAYGWFDNTRTVQLKEFKAADSFYSQYTSESNALTMGLRLRSGYTFKQPNYFVKPFVDVDLLYTQLGGFSEQGQGSLALKANSSDQFNLAISPMVELGADIGRINNRQIKAYANAGATFLPGNTITTPMKLANGLASAGTYGLVTDGPSILGRLNLGLQAFVSEQLELRAQYGLQAGDGYSSQSITGSMTYRF